MTSMETAAALPAAQAPPRHPPTPAAARRREIVYGLLHSSTFLIGTVILLFWIIDAAL